MHTEIKRLKLRKLSNTRDLSDLPSNVKIARGKLIRSAKLYKLPRSTVKKLKAYNIQTIIDLRTEQEAAEKPDTIFAHYVNLSLLNAGAFGITFEKNIKQSLKAHADEILKQFGTPDQYMSKIYDHMLFDEVSQEKLTAALRIIICANGGVIWHCTGGKDRAGILAMLVESLLGVDEETILLDYAATGIFQRRRNRMFKLFSVFIPLPRKTKKMLMEFMKTNPIHLKAALDKIKTRYGSVTDYCKAALGITEEEILTLQAKYLE